MEQPDRKAIVLVIAGALIGFYPLLIDFYNNQIEKGEIGFIQSTLPTIAIGVSLAFLIIICLLYGSGVVSQKQHMNNLTKRWQRPLLIGVLDDIKWDVQNPISVGTDLKADDWKEELECCAKELNLRVNIEYVEINAPLDSFTSILNPYGSVYPESDLGKQTSFHQILDFVSEGGLFVNVADIPFYFAYDSKLGRILDTTQAVVLGSETNGQLKIVLTRPYFLTPLSAKLSLQIVGKDEGFQTSVNEILGVRGMVGTGAGLIVTRRILTVESNVESCVPVTPAGNTGAGFVSPIAFVKYGSGDFLFSLPWINDRSHDLSNRNAMKRAICLLALRRLTEGLNRNNP